MQLLKHQWAYPRGISLLAAENVKTCTCTKLSVGVCFVSVVEDLLTHVLSLWWRSYTSGKSSYSSFIVLLNWIVAHNMCWQAFHHSQNKQQQREGWVQAKKESFNKESDTDTKVWDSWLRVQVSRCQKESSMRKIKVSLKEHLTALDTSRCICQLTIVILGFWSGIPNKHGSTFWQWSNSFTCSAEFIW